MRRVAVVSIVLMLLVGCHAPVKEGADQQRSKPTVVSPAQTPLPAPRQATAPVRFEQVPDGRSDFTLRSLIPDMHFIATEGLPRIEPATDSSDTCDAWGAITPQTPAGKLAASLGWRVAGEEGIGALTAVVVIRKYDFEPGAMCVVTDGNLVLFDGIKVMGVLQRDEKSFFGIGRIEKLESGSLRVWTSTSQRPLGDLGLVGHDLRFAGTAAMDTACDGRMKVPNLFRMSIKKARSILIRAGWKPFRVEPIDRDDLEYGEYYRRGVIEIESCSNHGQCLFHYRSATGNLTLETGIPEAPDNAAQSDNWVIFYAAECRMPSGKIALDFNAPGDHSRYF
jgi:hypothetical protein